jgi:hypothetical protein
VRTARNEGALTKRGSDEKGLSHLDGPMQGGHAGKVGTLAKWARWQGGLLHRESSSPGVCLLQGMLLPGDASSRECVLPCISAVVSPLSRRLLIPQAPYPAGSLSPSVYLLDVPPRRIPSKRPGPTRPAGTRDREGKPSTYIPGRLCKLRPNNFTHEEKTSSIYPTPPLGAKISITGGAYRTRICHPRSAPLRNVYRPPYGRRVRAGRAYQTDHQTDHQTDLPDACPPSPSACPAPRGAQRSRRA